MTITVLAQTAPSGCHNRDKAGRNALTEHHANLQQVNSDVRHHLQPLNESWWAGAEGQLILPQSLRMEKTKVFSDSEESRKTLVIPSFRADLTVLSKRGVQPTLGERQAMGGCFASQRRAIGFTTFFARGRTTSFSPLHLGTLYHQNGGGKEGSVRRITTPTHKKLHRLASTPFHYHKNNGEVKQKND